MATREQIDTVLRRLEQVRPADCFKRNDEMQAGIGAVLRLLYESDEEVTAGRISEVLGVSTARVAVLIRKMESKGLITKERGARDGRVTIARLTESGRRTIEEIKENLRRQIGIVIDAIGEERFLEFIATAEEIERTVNPPSFIV